MIYLKVTVNYPSVIDTVYLETDMESVHDMNQIPKGQSNMNGISILESFGNGKFLNVRDCLTGKWKALSLAYACIIEIEAVDNLPKIHTN